MANKSLPPHASLIQYKKQAKDLLKAVNSGDSSSIDRLEAHISKGKRASNRPNPFTLADAQLTVAREHGFESWPRFAKQIEAQYGSTNKQRIWQAAEAALIAGAEQTLDRMLREHAAMFRNERPLSTNGLTPDYSGGDVQTILVKNHEFENWDQFEAYRSERAIAGTEVHDFEAAADAIVGGQLQQLDALLKSSPDLIHARSTRKHHSMLLHYVGANGIEYFRQRSPKNIVAITKLLIDTGADVAATADMYGGGQTALGLTATSVHPERAGVQNPLMELLLNCGATPGDANAINGCLANGRKAAAEWYAKHGAPIDLEGAAGVGRLDLVKGYFASDHSLNNGATQEQMNRGFAWACEYGRTEVAKYLLDMGMDVGASLRNHGQTGLHWAAHCAHISVAKLLLKRGADVDKADPSFRGSPLSWAMHGWGDPQPGTPKGRYYSIVKLLIRAGATVDPAWFELENVKADPQMAAALNEKSNVSP
jgi:ankyrin repeat protein